MAQARDYVLCANADIPCESERIRAMYGEQFPLRVCLEYDGIQGYGWVFPKRRHICVGIGGRMADNRGIRRLYSKFFRELQERGHLPAELRDEGTTFDLDPVGAVYHLPSLTRGRVMLIGDAAGFVSGSTGEGISGACLAAKRPQPIPNCFFAASLMRPGSHGGSQTTWTLADFTPGIALTFVLIPSLINA